MGSEALAKAARRDIRRAFAPEASEEVLKFVDGVKQELALDKANQHNVNVSVKAAAETLTRRVDDCVGSIVLFATKLTLWQRLRWLATGTWL